MKVRKYVLQSNLGVNRWKYLIFMSAVTSLFQNTQLQRKEKASTITESAIPRRFLAISERVVKLQKVQCFSYTNRQQTEMVVSGCISLEALEWKRFAHVAKQRRLEKVN